MNRCFWLVPVIAALAFVGPVMGQAARFDSKPVTVEATNAPLTRVLSDLAKQLGVGMISDGTDAVLVTLSLSDIPFRDCMDALADTFSVLATWEQGTLVVRTAKQVVGTAAEQLAEGRLELVRALTPIAFGETPHYGLPTLHTDLARRLVAVVDQASRESLSSGRLTPEFAAGLARLRLQNPANRSALAASAASGFLRQGQLESALQVYEQFLLADETKMASWAWGQLLTTLHYANDSRAPEFWERTFSYPKVAHVIEEAWRQKKYRDGLHFGRLNIRYANAQNRPRDAAQVQAAVEACLNARRVIDVTCAVDEEALGDPRSEAKVRARVAAVSKVFEEQFDIEFRVTEIIPWDPPATNGFEPQYRVLRRALGSRRPELTIGFILEVFEVHPSQFKIDHQHMWLGYGCPHMGAYMLTRDFSFEYSTDREALEWTLGAGAVAETLTHEMGHMFGALHVDDRNSVMQARSTGGRNSRFDELNTRVILTQKWRDFSSGVESLDEPELRDLAELYTELTGASQYPNGAAQEKARTHLALAKLYRSRLQFDLAREELEHVLAIGTPREIVVEAQAMFAG